MFEETLDAFGEVIIQRLDITGYYQNGIIAFPYVVTVKDNKNINNLQILSNNDRLIFFNNEKSAQLFADILNQLNVVYKMYGDLT